MEDSSLNPLISIVKKDESEDFIHEDMHLKQDFIAKVYSVLIVQLIIISLMVFLSLYSLFYQTLTTSALLTYISSLMTILFLFIPLSYKEYLQKIPYNFLILISFTMTLGYVISSFTSTCEPNTIFFSLLLAFITVITLMIYAWYTESDISLYGGILSVLLISLVCVTVVRYFYPDVTFMEYCINIGALLVFSGYVIYDTQNILERKENEFTNEDYILVAMFLFSDIIEVIMALLAYLSIRKKRNSKK